MGALALEMEEKEWEWWGGGAVRKLSTLWVSLGKGAEYSFPLRPSFSVYIQQLSIVPLEHRKQRGVDLNASIWAGTCPFLKSVPFKTKMEL